MRIEHRKLQLQIVQIVLRFPFAARGVVLEYEGFERDEVVGGVVVWLGEEVRGVEVVVHRRVETEDEGLFECPGGDVFCEDLVAGFVAATVTSISAHVVLE